MFSSPQLERTDRDQGAPVIIACALRRWKPLKTRLILVLVDYAEPDLLQVGMGSRPSYLHLRPSDNARRCLLYT